ncbi:MAG: hypothetical protein ACFBZ9_10465 [Sphingomonadales bacterium]
MTQQIKAAVKPLAQPALDWLDFQALPTAAKAASKADRAGSLAAADPGPEAAIKAALSWLSLAQDQSTTADGGVARHWSYLTGWGASYPETTGYIVPTFLEQAALRQDAGLEARARTMLDWLVDIQFEDGGFQGGMIGQTPKVPVTFNTGQILLGLAAGSAQWPERYSSAMATAADFLSASLDDDGCWRSHPTPFAVHDDKAYETHVAWGLYEAARVTGREDWAAAATRQVDWALTHQRENGWMDQCCLSDKTQPLTHTLGYALRGIVEAWHYTQEDRVLAAALRLAEGLRGGLESDGRLPGAFDAAWRPAAKWSCLTGSVQIAHSWFLLFKATGDTAWQDAGQRANAWVRRTIVMDGDAHVSGAVKGSYPVDGDYCRFEFPNWAAKFLIDSCQIELDCAGS